MHLGVYVVINLMLFAMAFITHWFEWFIPVIVLLGWGSGLVAHALDTYFQTSTRIEEQRERQVLAEIERERLLRGIPEDAAELQKPKRQQVSLSDDGELVYEDEKARKSSASKN